MPGNLTLYNIFLPVINYFDRVYIHTTVFTESSVSCALAFLMIWWVGHH